MSNIDQLLATLPIMAQGMGGIFIVMLVIFLRCCLSRVCVTF